MAEQESEFYKAVKTLINSQGLEIGSHTPDFVLAAYLNSCLNAFDLAVSRREAWYGRRPPPKEIDNSVRPGAW